MGQARSLIPYAAFAALVVVASVVALVVSTGQPAPQPLATPSATPVATAAPSRPSTDLSAAGRLAYWRSEANGDYLLWLANADNSRRRSVAKADQPGQVSKTRWSADGNSVAYVVGGTTLVVVGVDGKIANYSLPNELRIGGYHIVDHRFSPSGRQIAATVQRTLGSQSDVYLVAGGAWTRITSVEDALAADWLNEDELLLQTTGGIIESLRVATPNALRPLTGLTGATPIIGDDGRIHFLSGRVAGLAGPADTQVFAAASSVWSMTADGGDLRRELVVLDQDSVRLDGRWPGGSYLLHKSTNSQQLVFGPAPVQLPGTAGAIERITVAPDKHSAIGFTASSILRIDIWPDGPATTPLLLLGAVGQADIWFPRTEPIVGAPSVRGDAPAQRYAFAQGGSIWTMGSDGVPSLFRSGATNAQTLRRFPVPVKWSPDGSRILTLESLGSGTSSFQLVAVLIDRDGGVTRLDKVTSVARSASWSPDSTRIAVVALPATMDDPAVLLSNLDVRFLTLTGDAAAAPIPGREVAWTRAGVFVLSNGTVAAGSRARDEQAIELWNGTTERTVTPIARLVGDPRALAPATTRGITQVGSLSAAADGSFIAVRISFLGTTVAPVMVLVRAADGTPTTYFPSDRVADEDWSPTRSLIGYTQNTGSGAAAQQTAVVRDAATGGVMAQFEGRFAGWSPDGTWFYLGRPTGLYAQRLGGGDAVRVSAIGVPVTAARP